MPAGVVVFHDLLRCLGVLTDRVLITSVASNILGQFVICASGFALAVSYSTLSKFCSGGGGGIIQT